MPFYHSAGDRKSFTMRGLYQEGWIGPRGIQVTVLFRLCVRQRHVAQKMAKNMLEDLLAPSPPVLSHSLLFPFASSSGTLAHRIPSSPGSCTSISVQTDLFLRLTCRCFSSSCVSCMPLLIGASSKSFLLKAAGCESESTLAHTDQNILSTLTISLLIYKLSRSVYLIP